MGERNSAPKLEQVQGEGLPMARDLLGAILRVKYDLPIVKYTPRIIVA